MGTGQDLTPIFAITFHDTDKGKEDFARVLLENSVNKVKPVNCTADSEKVDAGNPIELESKVLSEVKKSMKI